jgi:hypothetical protein
VRILLDECVPARLKNAFPGHAVQSVIQAGWRTSKDSTLLGLAQDRFDILITIDRRLETQNDLSKFKLGFIVARVPNNRFESFQPILMPLNAAVERVRPGEVIHIVSPEFR